MFTERQKPRLIPLHRQLTVNTLLIIIIESFPTGDYGLVTAASEQFASLHHSPPTHIIFVST